MIHFKSSVFVCLSLFLVISSQAFAGNESSGGGGAYVCRKPSGSVLSSHLVDLWESANVPFRWSDTNNKTIKIQLDNQTSVEAQVQKALDKLALVDPSLARVVKSKHEEIQKSVNPLPAGISLTIPKDLQTDYFPTGCPPEGMLRYNGVTSQLDLVSEIFSKLATKTDVAAAYLHEAIYKVFREGPDHIDNSILVRRLVGCIFSSDCIPAPTQYQPPADETVFKCVSRDLDLYFSKVRRESPNWKNEPWKIIMTRLKNDVYPGFEMVTESFGGWAVSTSFDSGIYTTSWKSPEKIWLKTKGFLNRFGYDPVTVAYVTFTEVASNGKKDLVNFSGQFSGRYSGYPRVSEPFRPITCTQIQ